MTVEISRELGLGRTECWAAVCLRQSIDTDRVRYERDPDGWVCRIGGGWRVDDCSLFLVPTFSDEGIDKMDTDVWFPVIRDDSGNIDGIWTADLVTIISETFSVGLTVFGESWLISSDILIFWLLCTVLSFSTSTAASSSSLSLDSNPGIQYNVSRSDPCSNLQWSCPDSCSSIFYEDAIIGLLSGIKTR